MAGSIAHYELKIKGRVQGVGYRAFASRIARNLKLKGYVKNLIDGSVMVEVEGPEEILNQFVIACKNGPGWAHVDDIIVIQSPVQGYQEFNVRY